MPKKTGIHRGFFIAPSNKSIRQQQKLTPELTARLAEETVVDFCGGGLDLRERGSVSALGWENMPEVACAEGCRNDGVAEKTIRALLTRVSAMDYSSNSDQLWQVGRALLKHPEIFEPSSVASISVVDMLNQETTGIREYSGTYSA